MYAFHSSCSQLNLSRFCHWNSTMRPTCSTESAYIEQKQEWTSVSPYHLSVVNTVMSYRSRSTPRASGSKPMRKVSPFLSLFTGASDLPSRDARRKGLTLVHST